MQVIRLKRNQTEPVVITTSLPLPGPSLCNSSAFPAEAYFEISLVSSDGDDGHKGCYSNGGMVVCLGLSSGDCHSRFPGTYVGSIGFNSDGSVFLEGMVMIHCFLYISFFIFFLFQITDLYHLLMFELLGCFHIY